MASVPGSTPATPPSEPARSKRLPQKGRAATQGRTASVQPASPSQAKMAERTTRAAHSPSWRSQPQMISKAEAKELAKLFTVVGRGSEQRIVLANRRTFVEKIKALFQNRVNALIEFSQAHHLNAEEMRKSAMDRALDKQLAEMKKVKDPGNFLEQTIFEKGIETGKKIWSEGLLEAGKAAKKATRQQEPFTRILFKDGANTLQVPSPILIFDTSKKEIQNLEQLEKLFEDEEQQNDFIAQLSNADKLYYLSFAGTYSPTGWLCKKLIPEVIDFPPGAASTPKNLDLPEALVMQMLSARKEPCDPDYLLAYIEKFFPDREIR